MSGSITLTVNLFGAFRGHENGKPLTLSLPHGATLGQARSALKAALNDHPLIDDSALADETQILPEDAVFERDTQLAILPPVCGG